MILGKKYAILIVQFHITCSSVIKSCLRQILSTKSSSDLFNLCTVQKSAVHNKSVAAFWFLPEVFLTCSSSSLLLCPCQRYFFWKRFTPLYTVLQFLYLDRLLYVRQLSLKLLSPWHNNPFNISEAFKMNTEWKSSGIKAKDSEWTHNSPQKIPPC